jgi:hypothetical protein
MMPSRQQELAVLRSVIYASLFDYPLTPAQLETGLIGVTADAAAIESWWRASELLRSAIEYRDGLYYPAGRGELVQTRMRREAVSRDLIERDQRILALVSRMPFVRMVALSGSLAHLNAEGSADLDLFVITAPNRVWSVTVATLVISKLLGCRKRVCMNYVVSENAMRVEPQDLFSANQIIHLQPIAGHEVFARFVAENDFVSRVYPNFALPQPRPPDPHSLIERVLAFGPAQLTELAARSLYRWHLRRRSSTWQSQDQVRLDDECLKLHTSSHRAATLRKLDEAMAAALERPLNVLV